MSEDYPWYSVINGNELQQGDILRGYPVFFPEPVELSGDVESDDLPDIEGGFSKTDVVIVSQSCDLLNDKIDTVILCELYNLADIEGTFGDNARSIKKKKEDIRQGKEPGFHMIASDDTNGLGVSIVVFKRVHTTPKEMLIDFSEKMGDRIRILPPYREHLSQAFARYFMRVGLPEDIPAFS